MRKDDEKALRRVTLLAYAEEAVTLFAEMVPGASACALVHEPSSVPLSEGRWANAKLHVVERAGVRWVVKDFRPCIAPIRCLFGPLSVWRELAALRRLADLPGIPQNPRRIDRYAFEYRFIEGRSLTTFKGQPDLVSGDFFVALEDLVRAMHARAIAHLDLHSRRNIIVGSDGRPALVDFASHLRLDGVPRALRLLLEHIDLAGVYKHWAKWRPEGLGGARTALLAQARSRRRWWPLSGYGGSRFLRHWLSPAAD